MDCKKCKYYGGYTKDATTISGWHFICKAPKDHLIKRWEYAEGALLPGKHCGLPSSKFKVTDPRLKSQ